MFHNVNTHPSTLIELSLRCNDLANLDTFSKSDPMVAVFTEQNGKWVECGRTEAIKDNLNPQFVKKVQIQYLFEQVQKLRFCVYDVDDPTKNLVGQDFIGEAYCKLCDIVTMTNSTLHLTLRSPTYGITSRGTLTVTSEEVREMNQNLRIAFRGHNLDKKDFFGKSDPYIVISNFNADGTLHPVFKTDYILNTLTPVWPAYTISAQSICNGDYKKLLDVACYDWNKSSKHTLIGRFSTCLEELLSSTGRRFALIKEKKKSKKGYVNSGEIEIVSCTMHKVHSFLDYICGGCEMKLMVAVDFTASNGSPSNKTSLHYIGNPNVPNDYVKAIRLVGDVLCAYDSTKRLPVFGFGARLDDQLSHCFPLNRNPSNPEVYGVDGVLQAYYQNVDSVQFFGPTNFTDIIRTSTRIAVEKEKQGQCYCILLILTDGVISDMTSTVNAICEASTTPLSIIIVGIGGADFGQMETLDGDDGLLSKGGVRASRDIVQFVPFGKYKDDPYQLSKQVLEELPHQVVQYFAMKNVEPRGHGTGIFQTYTQSFDPSFSTPPQGSVQPPPQGSIQPPPQGSIQPPPQGSIQPPPQGSIQPPPQGLIQPPPQ